MKTIVKMVKFFVARTRAVCFMVSLAIAVAMTSCAKQSEDVLMAKQPANTCDTLNMKFSTDVSPIFSANCYRCHSNGIVNAGVSLDVYSSVLEQVHNGRLIGDITHAPGFVPMPYDGGKLSDCEIAKIQAWIDEGAPNN